MMDTRAVASVLGEVLMLAITVLLASVVILSITSLAPMQHTPHVDIELTYNGSLALRHVGGEALNTDELSIKVFYYNGSEGYTETFRSPEFDPTSDVGSAWMFGQRVVINESTLNTTPPFEVLVLYKNALVMRQEVYQ